MILYPSELKRCSKRLVGFFNSRTLKRMSSFGILVPASLIFLSCAYNTYRIYDVAATSPSPSVAWKPPSVVDVKPLEPDLAIPVDQGLKKFDRLTLADAVDIALQNNPTTRVAWAQARAAAAIYGSTRALWYPSANMDGYFSRTKGASTGTGTGTTSSGTDEQITSYGAAATLSYLLFDFGGRSAMVENSRQALLAADWTHNSVIQNTVLQMEMAFFSYAGAKAMLEANRTSLSEADANLKAAEERHRIGMATNADVLQAKTAYSEIKLGVLSAEGQVRIARGSLMLAMGYPAHLFYNFEIVLPEIPADSLSQSIDQLVDQALTKRPDLQITRALALEAKSTVKIARSKMLPSLAITGSAGRMWLQDLAGYTDTYSGTLALQLPFFNGFSRQYDLLRAKAESEAAQERLRSVEQIVIFQVFSAQSEFLTACERLKTTADLVASAQQSEEVSLGRYKEGVGNILNLLSAQQALAMARAEQINARLGWFVALAQLAHDIGVLGPHGDNPLVPGNLFLR